MVQAQHIQHQNRQVRDSSGGNWFTKSRTIETEEDCWAAIAVCSLIEFCGWVVVSACYFFCEESLVTWAINVGLSAVAFLLAIAACTGIVLGNWTWRNRHWTDEN